MKELSGRVGVVTGAASGIGLAFAEALLDQGMRVVLADIDGDRLQPLAKRLSDAGGDVLAVPTDVSDAAAVDALARATLSTFGDVALLCSNAAIIDAALTWERSLADWKRILSINLGGAVNGIRTFVPLLLDSGMDGHVINVASIAAYAPRPGVAPYNASKSAIVALSETLAMDLASINARVGVSVVLPGAVATRLSRFIRVETDTDTLTLEPGVRTPADIADQMVRAVRNNWFYVFTHPERLAEVEARMNAILGGLRGVGSRGLPPSNLNDATTRHICEQIQRSGTGASP